MAKMIKWKIVRGEVEESSDENCIEFLNGKRFATVTFNNPKYIKRLKEIYRNDTWKQCFKYFHENDDGSVCAKIPLKWIKINPGRKPRVLTDEQRKALADRLKKGREEKEKKGLEE